MDFCEIRSLSNVNGCAHVYTIVCRKVYDWVVGMNPQISTRIMWPLHEYLSTSGSVQDTVLIQGGGGELLRDEMTRDMAYDK